MTYGTSTPHRSDANVNSNSVRLVLWPACNSQRQQPPQFFQAREIMNGRKDVHMRQRRLHPPGQWLVRRIAEQGVEPYHPARSRSDLTHGITQNFRFPGVPSIAHDDHNRTSVDRTKPLRAEFRERRAYSSAPRPAACSARKSRNSVAIRAGLELVAYPAQVSAEDKRLHTSETVLQRVEKLQEELAVNVHRP